MLVLQCSVVPFIQMIDHVRMWKRVPLVPLNCAECLSAGLRCTKMQLCTFTHTHSISHTRTRTLSDSGAPTQMMLYSTDECRGTAEKRRPDRKMTAVRVTKAVSCSRTETAGHRCCCWAGRGGPGRTAARPDWSAQGEAWWHTQRKGADFNNLIFYNIKIKIKAI